MHKTFITHVSARTFGTTDSSAQAAAMGSAPAAVSAELIMYLFAAFVETSVAAHCATVNNCHTIFVFVVIVMIIFVIVIIVVIIAMSHVVISVIVVIVIGVTAVIITSLESPPS